MLKIRRYSKFFLCMMTIGGVSFQAVAQSHPVKPEAGLAYKTGNPADWPKELDAVTAAPVNHKILLENDRVRVLEVTMAPSTVEPLHSHQWPSVLYIQSAGNFIDHDADGEIILDTRTLPEPMTFPMTIWKDSEAPHSVENLSDTQTIRLIRVEMKPFQKSSAREKLRDVNFEPSDRKDHDSEETWENWRWEGKDE